MRKKKASLIAVAVLGVLATVVVLTVLRTLRDANSIKVYREQAGKKEKLDVSPIEKDGTVFLSLKDVKKGFATIVQYARADGQLVFRGERGTTGLQVPDRTVQSIDGEDYIPLPILASAMGYDYTVKDKEVHIRVGPDKAPAPPAPTFTLATPYVNAADIRSIAGSTAKRMRISPGAS